MTAYAELHCISNFSFLRGASHPQELVKQAHLLGYHAFALTDECSLAGIVRAHIEAKDCGLKLIVGSEFHLKDGPTIVLLAQNRSGYGNLSQLITKARRSAGKGHYCLLRADFTTGIPGCIALFVPSPNKTPQTVGDLDWFAKTFTKHAWLACELFYSGHDRTFLQYWRKIADGVNLPQVATGNVHMHVRERRVLQDTLTALRLGVTVQTAGCGLYANGERHLRTLRQMVALYPHDLLAASTQIADLCQFSLDELRYDYPDDVIPPGQAATAFLRHLTYAGMQKHWPRGASDKVRNLVEHELTLIAELHYELYFLTVYDIVRFARSRHILCQGRGSAANSVVCFCLGITAVDPDRSELLFERFVSRERHEPPDIDVDFEHERREEVFQYIYQKYGRDRTAITATVITYRYKSALRDVGDAMGITAEQSACLAKAIDGFDHAEVKPAQLSALGFDLTNPIIARYISLVDELIGFPRHLSQHVGGFVFSKEPLSRLIPIENARKDGRTVIQWDKNDLDALGILKVDCLSLGMLTAIHRSFDLIAHVRGKNLSMASLPADDADVYAMIQRADTIGVFQIESRAQMAMLPRLKPANFYDLVIEISIVRPGPIQGEMVHPYLRRRQGLEQIDYPSEEVRGVLQRTLGVPIFQEQVIKLAVVAAGFSPGEADHLRRSMATWRRQGGFEHIQQRLLQGMQARGYTAEFANQILQQIKGFGEYGFPESHAASFALLVYVSAWLKWHEPAIFTCALLNSQPLGFYGVSQLIQDAQRHGVLVRSVDIRVSLWDCTLERDAAERLVLRLGLRLVSGLSAAAGKRLSVTRQQAAFSGLDDLHQRGALGRRDIDALLAADALSGWLGNRYQARWAVSGLTPTTPLPCNVCESAPQLASPTEIENVIADYRSLGLTLRQHPIALLRNSLARKRIVPSVRVYQLEHGQRVRVAGLVVCRQRPGTSAGVVFLTLEDETGTLNIIIWQRLAESRRQILLNSHLLGIVGDIQREGDVLHIIAKNLEDHSALLADLVAKSRDFH